jgi:hypothetical protein
MRTRGTFESGRFSRSCCCLAVGAALLAVAVAVPSQAARTGDAGGDVSASDFHPGNFVRSAVVDNALFPLRPGTQLIFSGSTVEENQRLDHRLVFTVTDLIKVIGGVPTTVVWDRDFSAGQLVEAELAFFAQDGDGNVWQLGEYPEEYENGRLAGNPVWIHGFRGARAGLSMKAEPRPRTPSYSLGWGPAVEFNDRAKVLTMGRRTCVPFGCFADVLVVDEFNPDEPGKHQLKYYAPGVGNVRVGWSGRNETSKEKLVLVDVVWLGPEAVARARRAALKLEAHAYRVSKGLYGRTPPSAPRGS